MISLQNNPILLPYQIKILQKFFAAPAVQNFFLTGGTALSAFYLAHRDSKDFDFFSIEPFEQRQIKIELEKIAQEMGAIVKVKLVADTYQEIYLENDKDNWQQRIDIVKEQPVHFGEILTVDGIRVDSLENIASNKILAIYGRIEPKDYVDLYLLIDKLKLSFEEMFELARQKDTGLFEFYFANMIAATEKIENLPSMRIPFDRQKMDKFYQNLSRSLLLKIKPKE